MTRFWPCGTIASQAKIYIRPPQLLILAEVLSPNRQCLIHQDSDEPAPEVTFISKSAHDFARLRSDPSLDRFYRALTEIDNLWTRASHSSARTEHESCSMLFQTHLI